MTEDEQIKADASTALAQSRSNSEQISALAGVVQKLVTSVQEMSERTDAKLDSLRKDVRAETRPNWAAVALGVAIVSSLIGGMFHHFNTRFELQSAAQREFWLQTNTRVERLEDNQDDLLKDEVRRYRDIIQEKITTAQ